ncbi:hypothetical protein [Trichothermofontia sp.]
MGTISPTMRVFWGICILTLLVWILRGVRVLALLPSSVIWVLLLLTIGAGIVAIFQSAQ